MIGSIRKSLALFLTVLSVLAGLYMPLSQAALRVSASPDEGGRVPYVFHFEILHTQTGGGNGIRVFRDMELPLGQALEAAGWLATAEGVSAYQYLWLPVGGGSAEWVTMQDAAIMERNDLTAAGVEYPSGHGTAGFALSVPPPEDAPEGYYDLYIRALDGMGSPCDLAAVLNLRYGEPDRVSDTDLTVSIPRLGREGEEALPGGSAVEGELLRIPPDGRVRLGSYNLAVFEAVKITYRMPETDAPEGERVPILGLKTAGLHSFGKADEAYNTTNSLVYAPLREREGEVTMSLADCYEDGELWLTGHTYGDLLVTEIQFVYNGCGSDRVAARIHLSGELAGIYFGGYNKTSPLGVTDPILGDVLRLEVQEATNDPYAYFRAGDLLRDHEITLDADEYTYLVFLYRADPAINTDRMNLYLCSGSITGPTEECNQGVTLQRDGKWHYLLVDLTQKENWGGIINGWRFDYISGESDPGDGVEFASVQLFRTAKAAQELAAQDPLSAEPYCIGDPVLIRDMREEQEEEQDFVLDPADTYEVTEPESEPPSEPAEETDTPSDPSSPETESAPEPTPAPNQRGCASSAQAMLFLVLPFAACLLSRAKFFHPKRS